MGPLVRTLPHCLTEIGFNTSFTDPSSTLCHQAQKQQINQPLNQLKHATKQVNRPPRPVQALLASNSLQAETARVEDEYENLQEEHRKLKAEFDVSYVVHP